MKVKFVASPIMASMNKMKEDAIHFFNDHGIALEETEQPEALIVLSGGSEEIAKDYLRDGLMLIPFGTANGLAASLEIQSYALEHNLNVPLISELSDTYIQWLSILENLKKQNVGLIGKPSSWLIKSGDYTILNQLNIPYMEIPLEELNALLQEDQALANQVWENATSSTIEKEEVVKGTKVYTALEKIVDKYKLTAFALRCFDMAVNLKISGCLSLSTFNTKKIPAACEGDVESLVTMMVANQLMGTPGFMINLARKNHPEYTFAHCTVALDLVESYSLTTHFETGYNVGINGKMPEGLYTALRMGKDKKYKYFVGETVEKPHVGNMCRTQITLKLKENPFRRSIGNHLVLVPGDWSKQLEVLQEFGWQLL
ncbi:hypothetical protein [Coprothermobacter platensis]|uniref:hypothetical protein n=1 Tax=Coprothermobacter platensis TaxID=108819 RepID=UPI000380C3AC|nr:hypothetical protein [Coprothermobacter platensis]